MNASSLDKLINIHSEIKEASAEMHQEIKEQNQLFHNEIKHSLHHLKKN